MKRLIVTRADDNVKKMAELTHPIIKGFAEKWDAEFLVLKNEADCNHKWGKIHYRIMELYALFEKYDRIANIDTDTIINKNCPNLFEMVPPDKIGVIFEDRGSRRRNRCHRIVSIQKAWGQIGWIKDYINIGIFFISRSHKEIFRKFKGKYWEGPGFCDVHLAYQIKRLGLEMLNLGWRFNHMSMFSEPWNGSPSRLDSHIIHYAGNGSFPDKGKRTKSQLIKDDIARIYG